jgi:transposase InsO family protein
MRQVLWFPLTAGLGQAGLLVGRDQLVRLDAPEVGKRIAMDDVSRAVVEMAIAFRAPPEGCIDHTDRGSQYCSHDYQKILRKNGFKASMSGKGNCYDNSAVETFFKTIKAELIWRDRRISSARSSRVSSLAKTCPMETASPYLGVELEDALSISEKVDI